MKQDYKKLEHIIDIKTNYINKLSEIDLDDSSSITEVKKEIQELFTDVPEHNGTKKIGKYVLSYTGLLTSYSYPVIILDRWEPTVPFVDPKEEENNNKTGPVKKFASEFKLVKELVCPFSYMHQLLFSGCRVNISSDMKFKTQVNRLLEIVEEIENQPDAYLAKKMVSGRNDNKYLERILSSFYYLFQPYYNSKSHIFHFLTKEQLQFIDYYRTDQSRLRQYLNELTWDTEPILNTSEIAKDITFLTNAVRKLNQTEDETILKLLKRMELIVDEDTLKIWEEKLTRDALKKTFDSIDEYAKSQQLPVIMNKSYYFCPMCKRGMNLPNEQLLKITEHTTVGAIDSKCKHCSQPIKIFITNQSLSVLKEHADSLRGEKEMNATNNHNHRVLSQK